MDRGAGDAGSTSLAARGQPATAGGAVLRAGGGFIGNTSITLLGLGAGAVLSMVNEVLAARFLGVAAYGLYALAMMAARVGEKIAVFGVPVSVLHYLPVHLNRDERQLALGAVVGGIPMSLGLGLALAFGLWIGADWIAAHVLGQPDAAYFIAVLGFAIPLMALIDLLGEITRGFGRALPYVVLRNLAPQLCTMAILIWLWRSHGPWSGVAYAQLGGLSIGVAVGIGFVLQMVRTRIGPLWPIMQLRRLYGYAVPIVGNTMVSLAMVWTDLFLLGILTDASAVKQQFRVSLLTTGMVNAFALPDGHVYVTRGMIDLMKKKLPQRPIDASNDALGHILGHELQHVIRRHNVNSAVFQAAVKDASSPIDPSILTHVTRLQEMDADRQGMVMAFLAGYHPRGGIEFPVGVSHQNFVSQLGHDGSPPSSST